MPIAVPVFLADLAASLNLSSGPAAAVILGAIQ